MKNEILRELLEMRKYSKLNDVWFPKRKLERPSVKKKRNYIPVRGEKKGRSRLL